MSRIKHLMEERDEQIRAFCKAKAEKKTGKAHTYRHTAILEMASKKFFLAPKTIERILSGNNVSAKKPSAQLDLIDTIQEIESSNTNPS